MHRTNVLRGAINELTVVRTAREGLDVDLDLDLRVAMAPVVGHDCLALHVIVYRNPITRCE